jgi:hypothetical protein
MSQRIIKFTSVLDGILKGCASFATTNNSFVSLYKPTVVTYGAKSDPVAKSLRDPLTFLHADGFNV